MKWTWGQFNSCQFRSSSLQYNIVSDELVSLSYKTVLWLTKVISIALDPVWLPKKWSVLVMRQFYDLLGSYYEKVENRRKWCQKMKVESERYRGFANVCEIPNVSVWCCVPLCASSSLKVFIWVRLPLDSLRRFFEFEVYKMTYNVPRRGPKRINCLRGATSTSLCISQLESFWLRLSRHVLFTSSWQKPTKLVIFFISPLK